VIKAIFFDWFNTLARFEPPRQELYRQAFKQFGFDLDPKRIIRGILAADRYYFEENAKSPVGSRSPEEQAEVYVHYPKAVLAEAGVEAAPELPLKIIKLVFQQFEGITFALFDDVLPTLKALKEPKLVLGLLTNIAQDIAPISYRLGLEPYLDVTLSSREVGADKPDPAIFLAALQRAGVEASEAVHVGDQYHLDVVGARGVGISPILIDRYDINSEAPYPHALRTGPIPLAVTRGCLGTDVLFHDLAKVEPIDSKTYR
jgi:putative hydrolase of the HAD superfamily